LIGVTALGGLSGCLDMVPFLGGDSGLANVPEDSEAAVYINLDTAREDDGTEVVVNAFLENDAGGPQDFDELLDEFENETNLAPEDAHELVAFAEYGDSGVASEYGGAIITTDWDESDVVDALEESGPTLNEEEEAGKTVYEPEEAYGNWMGVLEDGKYVFGTEDAVVESVELSAGEGEQIDEQLRNAYDSTGSSPVRFVSTVPDDQFPDEIGRGENAVDLTVVDNIEHASGSVYRDGEVRGLSVTLTVDDGDAVGDLADTINDVIELYQEALSEEISAELDEIEVSEESDAVTVSYENAVDDIEAMITG
jgi:hypothetical protein